MPEAGSSGVRLAELVGTLSLAVDLGLGQPMGHVARLTVRLTDPGQVTPFDVPIGQYTGRRLDSGPGASG